MTTSVFGTNGLKFREDLEPIVAAAVENVRTVVEEIGRGHAVLGLGPTGWLLRPLDDLEFEDAVKLYKEVVPIDARVGADLVLAETMSDSYELKVAVLVAREAGFRPNTGECLPMFAVVIFDEKERLLAGGNAESTVVLLEGLGVDALGIDCGLGPVQTKGALGEILRIPSLPVLVNPSTGFLRGENGETVCDIDVEGFVLAMEEIVAMGAVVTGGCYGITPEHIHLMARRCKDVPVT